MADAQSSETAQTPAPPTSNGAPAPAGDAKKRGPTGDGYDQQSASVAPGGPVDQANAPGAQPDDGGSLAAILRAAQKERDEPVDPTSTMLHGASIAYRMIDLYHKDLASHWAVSGAAGNAGVQGVKLTPAGKSVDVVVGRDFIVATDKASVETRAAEIGTAFGKLEAGGDKPVIVGLGQGAPVKAKAGDGAKDDAKDAKDKPADELLTPDQWKLANETNAKNRDKGMWAYNQVQLAFGAPMCFARMAAQNQVTGASQTAQPWKEALGATSLAIATFQKQKGLSPIDGIADDKTLTAAGFKNNGKMWTKTLTAAEGAAADQADDAKLAADLKAARKVGMDPAQSADSRRGAIVGFARSMIGTVDSSDRGDGKKTGGGRIVAIYKTLFGEGTLAGNREKDMRGAGTFANDSDRTKAQKDSREHAADWSWCGLFAAYCIKAPTGVGGWASQRPSGMAKVEVVAGNADKFKAANPQAGDILAISSSNNHHVLLAETPTGDMKGALACVEGNIEAQGIRESTRLTYANVTHVYKPF